MHYFYLLKRIHAHAVKQDLEQKQGVKNMNCQECNHEKGKCDCICCCSISKIGCVFCILPVLGYRQVKKILRKKKSAKN